MPTTGSPEHPPALRWWQYVGPWPLSPVPVSITLWLTTVAYDIARITGSKPQLNVSDYPPVFVKALPAAAIAFVILWLFSRMRPPVHTKPPLYWLAIALAVIAFVAVRFTMGLLPTESFATTAGVIGTALARTTFTVMFIQIVIGVTSYRLATQVARTNDALALVRDQQTQMLEADERMRAQVSTMLHDRVQAGLIAACLQLQDSAERVDPQTRSELADVVHRLEELRGLDVRRAARTLSPNLSDTDLQSALDDLGAQYAPSMLVVVDVSREVTAQATRPPETVLLGCYRIVEQALLNAAVHGRARNCHVDVAEAHGELVVTIDDDGSGMPRAASTPGLGTALTTTWVRILDGRWSRTTSPMGGVRVTALLPDPHA